MPNRFPDLNNDERRHIHQALVFRAKHLADTGRRTEAETVNRLIHDINPFNDRREATHV